MKKRNSRGFTLVELLIVVAIVGVFVALCGVGFTRCLASGDEANAEARKFAQELGMPSKAYLVLTATRMEMDMFLAPSPRRMEK
jgi:prepilin-type N-terminal cleavage/methylation domain-containing protein